MFLSSPPRYRMAAPTRQYDLVATLPFNTPSRVRCDAGINGGVSYRYLFLPQSFDAFLGQPIQVWINHHGPAVGLGVLAVSGGALQLRLSLTDDQPEHRQLIADDQAGRLNGISVGEWKPLGFFQRVSGVAEDVHVVHTVAWVGEVSLCVSPELATCFSDVSIVEKRMNR